MLCTVFPRYTQVGLCSPNPFSPKGKKARRLQCEPSQGTWANHRPGTGRTIARSLAPFSPRLAPLTVPLLHGLVPPTLLGGEALQPVELLLRQAGTALLLLEPLSEFPLRSPLILLVARLRRVRSSRRRGGRSATGSRSSRRGGGRSASASRSCTRRGRRRFGASISSTACSSSTLTSIRRLACRRLRWTTHSCPLTLSHSLGLRGRLQGRLHGSHSRHLAAWRGGLGASSGQSRGRIHGCEEPGWRRSADSCKHTGRTIACSRKWGEPSPDRTWGEPSPAHFTRRSLQF